MSYRIDSDGWRGGAKSYRTCPGCGLEKANTAFRCMSRAANGRGKGERADVCIKCQGGYNYTRTPGRPPNMQHDGVQLASSRLTFDEWARRFQATDAELELIRRAVERYGMKSPCPDDLLEEHTRNLPSPQRERVHGELFHGTVLLAYAMKNKGRMGTYNLAEPRGRRMDAA